MSDDLKAFVHDAVQGFEPAIDDDDDGHAAAEDTPAARMWARLSPTDQDAILGGDDDLYDRRAREDVERRLREGDSVDEADYDRPAERLHRAVRSMVVNVLEDPDGAWAATGQTPEEWVAYFATCSPAEWAAYCRETGWRPEVRPSRRDLPEGLQMELTKRGVVALLERERKGYERTAG